MQMGRANVRNWPIPDDVDGLGDDEGDGLYDLGTQELVPETQLESYLTDEPDELPSAITATPRAPRTPLNPRKRVAPGAETSGSSGSASDASQKQPRGPRMSRTNHLRSDMFDHIKEERQLATSRQHEYQAERLRLERRRLWVDTYSTIRRDRPETSIAEAMEEARMLCGLGPEDLPS